MLKQQVRPEIGCLDPVLDYMRQGHLDHLSGMIHPLGCPVLETGHETVRRGYDPVTRVVESELTAAAMNDEPLNLTLGSAVLDE